MDMHALVGNLIQLGMLGLGVSLLLVCVNHLKSGRSRMVEESDERSQEALAASAARRRTGA